MDDDANAARRLAPEDWGKAIIEEILFRAAREVSAQPAAPGGLAVTMVFAVTADQLARAVEISTPGAVEPLIVTQIKL